MREESVEVERRVNGGAGFPSGNDDDGDDRFGRHESDVIPASWPTRRASNVIENCCGLIMTFSSANNID